MRTVFPGHFLISAQYFQTKAGNLDLKIGTVPGFLVIASNLHIISSVGNSDPENENLPPCSVSIPEFLQSGLIMVQRLYNPLQLVLSSCKLPVSTPDLGRKSRYAKKTN